MSKYGDIAEHIKEAAGSVTTKSAMNSILWICVVLGVPSVIACVLSEEPYKFYFFCMMGLIAAVALLSFIFLLLFDRDRLQDEEFRLKDKALTIFGDSRGGSEGIDRIIHAHPITPAIIESRARLVREGGDERNA